MKKIISYILLFLSSFALIFGIVSCDNSTNSEESSISIDLNEDEYAITGKVTANGNALADSIIEIRNTSYITTTNSNGYFNLIVDSEDDFNLEIRKTGYKTKIVQITKENFIDKVASVNIELLTSEINIVGIVKDDKNNVLNNVKVSVDGTNISTKTNSNGEYSIIIERLSGYELVFYKEFYEIKNVVIDNIDNNSRYTQDVILTDLKIELEGTVSNIYEGSIQGAIITVVGTEYYAVSDKDGNYKIEGIELENMDFMLSVKKDGYFESIYPSSQANNLELIKDYTKLPQVGETHKFDAYVTKSSNGLYFKFYVDSFTVGSGSKEEKVQVFINPGTHTENNRLNGSHVAEIALCSNQDIVVVVNYINGDPEYITNFELGDDVIYESVRLNDGRTELNLFVKYSLFKEYFGNEFAIDANSVVGLNITSWSDFLEKPAEGWILNDMAGIDGNPLVDHNNPQDWPRLSSDGTYLYEHSNNSTVVMNERVITGKITNNGQPVKDVKIYNEELNIEVYSDENGVYNVVIPKEKFYLDHITLTYSKEGFVDLSYIINNFNENSAEKDVEMSSGVDKVSLTGIIQNTENVKLENAKVSIKGSDISTLADANGQFELIVENCSIPFTVVVEKENYQTKEIIINEKSSNMIITLMHEEIYLGTLGKYNLKCYVLVNGNTLQMRYESLEDIGTTEINQYLYFSDDQIYEVRFKKDWTGVNNVNKNSWELWNDKIQVPVYSNVDNKLVITQNINLAFFSNLGVDISNVKLCISENFNTFINYKDEQILNMNDIRSWALLLGEEPEIKEYVPSGEYLGYIGDENIKTYYSFENNIITFTYVSTELFTTELSQFIDFGNGTTYEVKFDNTCWTGIYNWDKLNWETWNSKVSNPKITTKSNCYVYTQKINLTYFVDLGVSSILIPKIAIKVNNQFIKSETLGDVNYNDKNTWYELLEVNKMATANTILFGHSNIEYWDNYKEDLKSISEKYDLGELLNIGVAGSSSSDWLGFKESLTTYNANNGIFWIGTNEMQVGATAEQIIKNIEDTILHIKENNQDFMVVMVLVPISPGRLIYKDKILQLNNHIRALSDKYDWIALADLEYAYCDLNGNPDSKWFEDGVHLTDDAYVQIFVPAIDKALEEYYK